MMYGNFKRLAGVNWSGFLFTSQRERKQHGENLYIMDSKTINQDRFLNALEKVDPDTAVRASFSGKNLFFLGDRLDIQFLY